jgi:uncharacterized protein (DUF58 family)
VIPSARLIWLVALAGFPAAALGAVEPAARTGAFAVMAVVAIAVVGDAAFRRCALAGIRVELPEMVRSFKDRDSEIRVRIHNQRAAARRVRIGIVAPEGIETSTEDQLAALPEGAPAADLVWRFTPRRRGLYRVETCYLEAASPLGLWAVRRQDAVGLEIRVYPNLRRDADLNALRRGVQGMHALRQVGRGREFEKLREYAPGDGFDEIHWKATARRGRPITKVFQVERTQEVYVVIDASRLSGRLIGGETALERAIAAALVVGAAAERRGDLFGLAAFSHQVEAFTRARNGKAHYAACRDAIYRLQPRPVSPDFDEIATLLRLRLRRRALLLFLTGLDDPVLAENFARATRLLARRHLVLAGMLRPPSAKPLFSDAHPLLRDAEVTSSDDIYRQLGGHLAWRKLRELEATLARQGVRLALLEPASFSASLVNLYDEVKQRQLL